MYSWHHLLPLLYFQNFWLIRQVLTLFNRTLVRILWELHCILISVILHPNSSKTPPHLQTPTQLSISFYFLSNQSSAVFALINWTRGQPLELGGIQKTHCTSARSYQRSTGPQLGVWAPESSPSVLGCWLAQCRAGLCPLECKGPVMSRRHCHHIVLL